jgi:hypothetical protein
MGVSLPAGYGPLYGLWASLPVGLRVTGLSLRGLPASLFAGCWPLPCGLWASLRVTGVSTGYGPLYGLWASLPCGLWASLSTGYWPLSLRVMGISPLRVMGVLLAGCGRLYGLLASLRVAGLALSTYYSCGSASTATLTRASTGGCVALFTRCGSASTATLARYLAPLRVMDLSFSLNGLRAS